MRHLKTYLNIYLSIIIFALSAGVTSAVIKTIERANLVKEARITMEQARYTALRCVPGAITDSDLKRRSGRAVYEFEFEPDGCLLFRVQVDAVNGEIISAKQEPRRVNEWERECRDVYDDRIQFP